MDSLAPEESALIDLGADLYNEVSANRTRGHNVAFPPSTNTQSTKSNANGKESRLKESPSTAPPPMLSGENGSSHKHVIGVTEKTFQVRNEGPHYRFEDGGVNISLPMAPPQRNLSDSALGILSDTSSGRNTTLRGRARISSVPARYRQPSEQEPAIKMSVSKGPKKRPSTVPAKESAMKLSASEGMKNNDLLGVSASSTGEKTPLQDNVKNNPSQKSVDSWRGVWTEEEQNLFEDGCILHGWGNWKSIQQIIPTRNRHQVKSHAQKFAKHYPEVRDRLQKEHARQLMVPKSDPFIRANDRKQNSQSKNKLASNILSVSSGNIIAPPETTSKSESTSTTLKLDHLKKNAETSKAILPIEVMDVLTTLSPLSRPTSYDNKADNKSVIMVPKIGENFPDMFVASHETTAPHARTEFAKPTHDAIAAIPHLDSNPQELHVLTTKNEFSSTILDQSNKRTLTTNVSVVEYAPSMKKKKSNHDVDTQGSGSWTSLEHMQFEKGCILFGWGNWKLAESLIPSRNSVQIKSHAQKYSKNRPHEKERLMREHQEHMRQTELAKPRKEPDENDTEQGTKQTSTARNLQVSKYGTHGAWTLIEKKQFEDGCIFHGWGNWRDIASHIITKNISEVSAHAESYQLEDRERLEREHTLNYQDDDDDHIFHAEKNTKRFYHDLLLHGKKTTELEMSVTTPPNSTPKKNDDDYGAAEAILALNCANCGNAKYVKEATSVKKRNFVGTMGPPKTESASDLFQCEAMVANKANKSIEMSALFSPKEDQEIAKNSCVSVDTQTYEDKSLSESDETVGVDMVDETVTDTKYEAPNTDCAFAKPRGNTQPPPHWLATDTWDICLANIHRWNNKLTESERIAEFLHYSRLSSSEKECLREKLVNLMNNQPIAPPPSVNKLN